MPPTPSLRDSHTRPAAEPDAICAAAVELALTAATDVADRGAVGEHLTVVAEGDRVVTHFFACESKGYHGWRWAVTLSRAPRARTATVSEVVLLPGPDAVLAPAWVPWSDRIAPGDLGATDALPYRADDPLLEPGYAATGDADADELAVWELGLGRVRVLSVEGRDAAATRWYLGDRGPTAEEAVNATAACSTCGYFAPLAGSFRQVFGVCANEWSPSDGRVVSVDHGCGAHSETDVERVEPQPLPEPILDETGHETVVIERVEPTPADTEVPADGEPSAESEPPAAEPSAAEPSAAEPPAGVTSPAEAEPPADVQPSAEAEPPVDVTSPADGEHSTEAAPPADAEAPGGAGERAATGTRVEALAP